MTGPRSAALRLGADTIQLLVPHRRPFLMIDSVESLTLGPQPSLVTKKYVSANEPVFEGHFPGLALWPGVYTIEGLGQTANVLIVLLALLDFARERGRDQAAVLEALRAIDARARLGGRTPTDDETALVSGLSDSGRRFGFAGAIDVKLVEPVFAGTALEHQVTLTHVLANARRFDVEARALGRPVARGTITSAIPQ